MHPAIRSAALAALLPALSIAQTPAPEVVSSAAGKLRMERLAILEFPWGMAYLPDGRLLVTEKPGRLRIYANGSLSEPLAGVPTVSYRTGESGEGEQGGLLDVAVDPDFTRNRRIYLSYVEPAQQQPPELADTRDVRFADFIDVTDDVLRGGAVARATLDGERLAELQVIWRQVPKTIGRGHFGHRLIFAKDGTLFITSGDRMRFEPAQSLESNLGKVVRIGRDGSIPQDNPFAGRPDARGDIWSLGHRNMLAAAINPRSGQLWVWEMGPLGGDELNVIQRGRNYGWPLVSEGAHYNAAPIPPHAAQPDVVAPIRSWTPVLSPSGALFYDGALFPWRGDALIGGLSSQSLIRFSVDGTRIAVEERIDIQRRVRDLIQAPDGALLLLTDDRKGELLRLTPEPRSALEQGVRRAAPVPGG